MKSRHAAALALVGWYLMFPPIDPKTRFRSFDPTVTEQQPDLKAPLHTWWIADTFDSLDQCRAAITSMKPKPTGFWSNIRCVSSDDPRLKGRQLNFVPESK
jgi:hypothetical protein